MHINPASLYNCYHRNFYSGQKNFTRNMVVADTFSFGKTKKSQYSGIDLLCINAFKAPIEKFSKPEDLQKWAEPEFENRYKEKTYKGREEYVVAQRKALLDEWEEYFLNTDKTKYNKPTNALYVFKSITKDLKPNNDCLPPIFSKKILADTLDEIEEKSKNNSNGEFSFCKIYENNLRKFLIQSLGAKTANSAEGQWIVIPSRVNDPKNYEKNLAILKMLSCPNWCTKTHKADKYLRFNNFHIYMENNAAMAAIAFALYAVDEIAGRKNDRMIPFEYVDVIKKHLLDINEDEYAYSEDMKRAEKVKEDYDKAVLELSDEIKNKDYKKIFSYFDIDVKETDNGEFILSHFKEPMSSRGYTFSDMGINENDMLENVTEIENDADFTNCSATSLRIRKIGKNVSFNYSNINRVDFLEYIGGDMYFHNSHIKHFPKLSYIGGTIHYKGAHNDYKAREEIIQSINLSHRVK